jgi:hypothetical protein
VNRVVARFVDGSVVKGSTSDFSPGKPAFHLCVSDTSHEAERVTVDTRNLKALFFVKDLAGNSQHADQGAIDSSRRSMGRALRVEFDDGEVLVGTTLGYRPDRPGFFLEPADSASNNERCYILATATRDVSFIEHAPWERFGAVSTAPRYA